MARRVKPQMPESKTRTSVDSGPRAVKVFIPWEKFVGLWLDVRCMYAHIPHILQVYWAFA
jgi:hypothetical protein